MHRVVFVLLLLAVFWLVAEIKQNHSKGRSIKLNRMGLSSNVLRK